MVPDWESDAEMLEWAGVGFGERDTYLIKQAIKKLSEMSGASKLRFAGKIYGQAQDFWIISGYLPDEGSPANKAQVESRGEGVNSQVYWAATDLLGDWI